MGVAVPAVSVLRWLPGYQRRWLSRDIAAAVAVWAVLVPEGMAYGTLAGLPPQTGLYAALAPLLMYALLGTCRQITVGPSSAVAVMSAAAVAPFAARDPARFAAYSAALAIAVGVILVLAGIARLGFISDFFARPVLTGFVAGLALVIGIGQVPKLFGIEATSGNFFQKLWGILGELGATNGWTLAVGLGSVVVITILHRVAPRAPAALIAVVAGIAAVAVFNLEARSVEVVGAIPAGLPSLGWPDVSASKVVDLAPDAAAVALVAYSESIAGARSFAVRDRYQVDANAELLALGASNLGTGVTQGFTVDASLSRSAVADAAGARTPLFNLFELVLVVVTLIALTPLFHDLPEAVLGAIVIAAVAHFFNARELRRLWNLNREDFVLAVACLSGVLVFGTLEGLLLAVIFSLLAFVQRGYRPATAVLGRVPGGSETDETYRFRDADRHPEYEQFPGLVILRFDGELFFANAAHFAQVVRSLAGAEDSRIEQVLVDAGAISYMDTTASDVLSELIEELAGSGVSLALARVKAPLHARLQASGLEQLMGEGRIYVSVRAGVDDYLDRHPGLQPISRTTAH